MNLENLKYLSNLDLLLKAKSAVSQEKHWTTQVLHHLREIERRRLHLERGYGSLHEFAVRELGYSDGAAHRRVAAMRLIHDVATAEVALNEGRVTLSTLAQAQSFFQAERREQGKVYSPEQKLEVLKSLEGKSTRECERHLAALSPELVRKEKERVISEQETEIRFTADQELMAQLQKIRELVSHRHPQASYAELFKLMAEATLKQLDRTQQKERGKNGMRQRACTEQRDPERQPASAPKPQEPRTDTPAKPKASAPKLQRYIPKSTQRFIWKRDGGQCSYTDPVTKLRCTSHFQLQIDHSALPFALGGTNDASNLRLLCANHNRLAAIKAYGHEKMRSYLIK